VKTKLKEQTQKKHIDGHINASGRANTK